MWDILLVIEQKARQPAESVLMAKKVRFQTEYMGIRKTWGACENYQGLDGGLFRPIQTSEGHLCLNK